MTTAAILADIEGTTSSIDFVHNVLFPYASDRLAEFVGRHQDEPEIASILDQARVAAGESDADVERITNVMLQWIADDKKVTALKALQGHMWQHGYVNGDFTGHVYDDAVQGLRNWVNAGIPVYIYSSGSVQAQQLLFGYSDAGDLRPLISGYFDTRVGNKRDAASYREIAASIACAPENMLFLSDVAEELDAARMAGMRTIQLVRDRKVVVGDHPVATDFGNVVI